MSIRVMSSVWDHFKRGGSEKLVLLALADWCDDKGGNLYPSIKTVAEKVCCSESQARRIIHGFIDEGLLSVVGNEHGGAPGASRRYRINLHRLTARTGATPCADATPSMDARDGSHGCAETASTGATLSIIDPSGTVKEEPNGSVGKADKKAKALPRCPYDLIVSLYHDKLPELPRVKLMSDSRKKAVHSFWKFVFTSKKSDGTVRASSAESALGWIQAYFERASQNDFLMGRRDVSGKHANWRADFDFLLTERGKKHVIERTTEAA